MGEITRRTLLKLTGCGGLVSMAGYLGLKSATKLIPYVIPPDEGYRPGVYDEFATTCRECPAGCGMRARCVDCRVIKCEGAPDHPVSRGGLCVRGQSALMGAYDPDRVKHPLVRKDRSQPAATHRIDWPAAIGQIADRIGSSGGRVMVLSDLQTGAMAELLDAFAAAFGSQRVLYYEPLSYDGVRHTGMAMYGLPVIPRYRPEAAELIVSFGCDFLETWISPVEFASGFARSHAYSAGSSSARMVYIGPRLSMTAANADEFIQVPPGGEARAAAVMLKEMLDRGLAKNDAGQLKQAIAALDAATIATDVKLPEDRLTALAGEFAKAKGSLALGGATLANVAAGLMNHAAGRIGRTVDYSQPHAIGKCASREDAFAFLSSLTEDDMLIVHGANPVYSLPEAAEMIGRAGTVVCLNPMMDETAAIASFVLPVNTPLESWGDYEPYEGIHGLIQPMMRPLVESCCAGDAMMAIAQAAGKELKTPDGGAPGDFEDWLHNRWQRLWKRLAPDSPFDQFWRDSLRNGGAWEMPKPAATSQTMGLSPHIANAVAKTGNAPIRSRLSASSVAADSLDLWLWPSVMLHDGRAANRGWLQEAPDPTSFLTWGSWIDIHPDTAARLGLADGDVAELVSAAGRRMEAPVHVTADVAPNTAAVPLGYGHWAMGDNARKAGRDGNGFELMPHLPSPGRDRVAIRKTSRRRELICAIWTQDQSKRELMQWTPLRELDAPDAQPGEIDLPLPEGFRPQRNVFPPRPYKTYRWAMVVDLDRCTGCGACAVACQVENNVPVVGPSEVHKGREMNWLQIVPYRDDENPRRVGFLPTMCQQCDAAPCEPVCPVFAAVHNEEGLNSQVYNRCIGTRYCSNNCPYKARRFNWLDHDWPRPTEMQLNPEVSVRSRGVMEKCTFCIQRIRHAQLHAKRHGQTPVRDGMFTTACAQSCPTRAIVFGNLMDKESQVARLIYNDPRRYQVLRELNTQPAVVYLRRVKRTTDQGKT